MDIKPVQSLNSIEASVTSNGTVTKHEFEESRPSILRSHGYILGKEIGSGSYSTVKVAYSNKHNSPVAIKIISKLKTPPDFKKKFLYRELDVIKRLHHHRNIIRFLQTIETTWRVFIIMEIADNGSLLDYIRKEKHLDEALARNLFRQLIGVLNYIHLLGVAHRDIKCENLLLDREFRLKLTDFGFAKADMLTGSAYSSTFCGSYAYACPEILRGIPYDPRQADVWASGVVMFAMLFGRLPYDDRSLSILIKVQGHITFPSKPVVSKVASTLINNILTPCIVRLTIPQILADPWLHPSNDKMLSLTEATETKIKHI